MPKITRKEAPCPQPFRRGTSPCWLECMASPTYPAQGTRIWMRGLSGCQQCPQTMPQQLQTRAVQHTSPACPSPLPALRAGELRAPPRCSNSPPFADAFDLRGLLACKSAGFIAWHGREALPGIITGRWRVGGWALRGAEASAALGGK